MELAPLKHFRRTAALARALKPTEVYSWLVTIGYYPESYVLPPCFRVISHPSLSQAYSQVNGRRFNMNTCECLEVHFPKTDWTERTFGIIHPQIHAGIASILARNWKAVIRCIFHSGNKVCSCSFPIPVDLKKKGCVGSLRSGRMIYEFIEMAENDVASIAYRYKYLLKTDIKNFYPSIYTHSIPWALHGRKVIRKGQNRNNKLYFGNRLDQLFRNANDGCTNGIPIGPAVSDVVAEIVLAGVDRLTSKAIIDDSVCVVRFKDDYRVLAKTEDSGRSLIKQLQRALGEYRLELNDEKTQCHVLPAGVFREWASQYHAANPRPKSYYSFKRFKEVYLAVVEIDRNNPNTGVVDRFLADIVTKNYRPRLRLDAKSLPKVISLLLMLGRLRTKAFPKVLAIIELARKSSCWLGHVDEVLDHLAQHLVYLSANEGENGYLLAWICYFLRSNGWNKKKAQKLRFKDPVVKATYTSQFTHFKNCKGFSLFEGVRAAAKRITMVEHLDVFKPQ